MILIWQKASGVGCLLKYDKAEGQMLLTTMHRNPTQSTAAIQIGSCDGFFLERLLGALEQERSVVSQIFFP